MKDISSPQDWAQYGSVLKLHSLSLITKKVRINWPFQKLPPSQLLFWLTRLVLCLHLSSIKAFHSWKTVVILYLPYILYVIYNWKPRSCFKVSMSAEIVKPVFAVVVFFIQYCGGGGLICCLTSESNSDRNIRDSVMTRSHWHVYVLILAGRILTRASVLWLFSYKESKEKRERFWPWYGA